MGLIALGGGGEEELSCGTWKGSLKGDFRRPGTKLFRSRQRAYKQSVYANALSAYLLTVTGARFLGPVR